MISHRTECYSLPVRGNQRKIVKMVIDVKMEVFYS